jgi:hypothetical protein
MNDHDKQYMQESLDPQLYRLGQEELNDEPEKETNRSIVESSRIIYTRFELGIGVYSGSSSSSLRPANCR